MGLNIQIVAQNIGHGESFQKMLESGEKCPFLRINNLSTLHAPFVDKTFAKKGKNRKFFCVSA